MNATQAKNFGILNLGENKLVEMQLPLNPPSEEVMTGN